MAVVGRPELVFLDEPTAGLDPQARHATWDVVDKLRADGVTVVLTTHYMEEAERLADTVVVIDAGRVVADRVADRADPRRGRGAAALPGHARAWTCPRWPPRCRPAARCPSRSRGTTWSRAPVDPQLLAAVTVWCAGAGVLVEDLRVQRRSLEDVFLDLTGRDLR